MTLSQINLQQTLGGFHATFPGGIAMHLTRLRERSGNAPTGYLLVTHQNGSGPVEHIHAADLNLAADRTRDTRAKILNQRYACPDWDIYLEQLCALVMQRIQQGDPPRILSSSNPLAKPPEFALWPLIFLNQPNIIFGDGAAMKGHHALLAVALLQAAARDNQLGLLTRKQPLKGLYLDWESDGDTIEWTFGQIVNGLGLAEQKFIYKRCYRPFSEIIVEVFDLCEASDIGFVVVDSLGPACGMIEINAPAPAFQLFNALRELGKTSLIIAHNQKGDTEKGKRKTVYGSVFFENLARNVWECRKSQEIGSPTAHVGLFHAKPNLSGFLKPIGLRWDFWEGDMQGDSAITISRADIADVPDLSGRLPIHEQIKGALSRGPMSSKDLAEELSATEASIRTTLNRFRGKRFSKGEDGTWTAL